MTGPSLGSSGRRTDSKTVVDSWAWVELFKASFSGGKTKERIDQSDEVFTPSLVLAELARKYLREGEEMATIRWWLQVIIEVTQVVEIDMGVAEESARASVQLVEKARKEGLQKPGLGDAIVLAIARTSQASVLTGDPHFRGLPETIWVGD